MPVVGGDPGAAFTKRYTDGVEARKVESGEETSLTRMGTRLTVVT